MTTTTMKKSRLALAALLIALTTTGCAIFGPDLPAHEVVQQRAQSWADALMAGDVEGAYAYTSPNFREFSSAALYRTRVAGSGSWTSAVVDSVNCADDEETCTTQVMVEYTIKRMNMSNRRPLKYTWVKVDGQWWLYVPPK